MTKRKLNISTINPSNPFLDTLAQSLLDDYKNKEEALSDILILLPTRRTCRALQDSFLKLSNGNILILPRMQPIGDIDAEELTLSLPDNMALTLNPPIPAIKRQILLAKLIKAMQPNHAHGLDQDLKLAKALGNLLDEIHTENLEFSMLTKIVEEAEIAEHWQITLGFLELLSIHWPKILNGYGVTDAAAYRNTLINTLNELWQKQPPAHPVIMAGSTGSIPATGGLAKTIASLPNGQVILPGLDKIINDKSWNDIVEGHPQATLKFLLERIEITRHDVEYFKSTSTEASPREQLISSLMLPASQTYQWGESTAENTKNEIEKELNNIHRYDCDTIQQEADIISLILRETLEDKSKTAALVTTNRQLARRVTKRCEKWGITLDDTAGKALTDTALGQYLHVTAHCCVSKLDSVALLSFLKHDFTSIKSIKSIKNFRHKIRNLETEILRGKPINNDFTGLEKRYHQKDNDPMARNKPTEETLEFIHHLKENISPFFSVFQKPKESFDKYLKNHIQMAETFYGFSDNNLWSGDDGEAASKLFSELNEYNSMLEEINPQEYLEIITQFMSSVTIRPKFGTHPRLQILGQIEGRLVQTDRVILAGLNEGSWPPDPGHDPWMSRPMRQKFGLPSPERSITLAAHDFSQAFCAKEVFLTRSVKIDGSPTVPARWLQRLDTYLNAINIDPLKLYKSSFFSHLHHMDKAERSIELERPAPKPPLKARPKKLSVTHIEKWMQDPYSIYAQKILKLDKLPPLNDIASAADRGTIFHEILYRFNKKYPKLLSNVTAENFNDIAIEVLNENKHLAEEFSFWRPRLLSFSEKYLEFEKSWRENNTLIYGEIKGCIDFNKKDNINFILSARVDRIDKDMYGNYAIIDYKSGGQFSASKITSGQSPQLPLEAIILSEGEFEKVPANQNNIGYLGYWTIDNSSQSIKETAIKDSDKINQSMTDTKAGLISLIQTYQNEDTAYIAIPNLNNAPRFNDYEHLERVKEWAALGEEENGGTY